jgi:hypothetical protein
MRQVLANIEKLGSGIPSIQFHIYVDSELTPTLITRDHLVLKIEDLSEHTEKLLFISL